MNERWLYLTYSPDSDEAKALAGEAGISPLTAAVALNRGITDAKHLQNYLAKSTADFHSPFLLHDMEQAVSAIRCALKQKKKITVYGDYDVDGITSVSILTAWLRENGADADYYIPDRIDEGYGVNAGALRAIREKGSGMVITVDTGITACEEAKLAAELGLELIITDHHQCKDEIPDCIVVNPCRHDCGYPFKSLAGVGVVFKLLSALEDCNHQKILDRFGDIIALGTVADVVPLIDENRIIVAFGLQKLVGAPCQGLAALLQTAGYGDKPINVGGIGFGLAPRINAAGRIGDTGKAVKLLLSSSLSETVSISEYLDEENKSRQATEQEILSQVLKLLETDASYASKKVLVIAGHCWHHGVIGIVASRITERFCKPCLLISCENGVGKGSGRSVKGFNLFEAMKSCGQVFEKYGGHALAAGLTILQENIPEADRLLNRYADQYMPPECLLPYVTIDCELSSDYLSVGAAAELELLEPYGTGNPQPCFSVRGARIVSLRLLSGDKHIRFLVEKGAVRFDVIAFGQGGLAEDFLEEDLVDLAGALSVNRWNNRETVQMVLKAIRLSEPAKKINPIPERNDLAAVYTYLKRHAQDGFLSGKLPVLARKIARFSALAFDLEKLKNCLEVFAELRLLTYAETDSGADLYLLDTGGGKVNLEDSKKLQLLRKGGSYGQS